MALIKAIKEGNEKEAIQLINDNNYDVNETGSIEVPGAYPMHGSPLLDISYLPLTTMPGFKNELYKNMSKALISHPAIDINAQYENDEFLPDTALQWAACQDNALVTELILANPRCNVNQRDNGLYERSALHWAVENYSITSMKILLSHDDVDVNLKDALNETALIIAMEKNHPIMVEMLFAHPNTNINVQGKRGRTPLLIAVANQDESTVKMLLNRAEIEVNRKDETGRTPLFEAVWNNNINIVKLLLANPHIDVSSLTIKAGNWQSRPYTQTLIGFAICNTSTATARLILSHPMCRLAEQNFRGMCSLHQVIEHFRTTQPDLLTERLEMMIQIPPKLVEHFESGQTTPILSECRQLWNIEDYHNRQTDLIESARVVDYDGYNFISFYIDLYGTGRQYFYEELDGLDWLSRASHEMINACPNTFAHAVDLASAGACKKLLKLGADPNSGFLGGENAIFIAIRQRSLTKIKILMEYGVNLTVKWNDHTPVQYAMKLGCCAEILRLLSQNIHMDVIRGYLQNVAYFGESAVACSIRLQMLEWVEYFVRHSIESELDADVLRISYSNENIYRLILKHVKHKRYAKCYAQVVSQMRGWYCLTRMCSTYLPVNSTSTLHVVTAKQFHTMAFGCHDAQSRDEIVVILESVLRVFTTVAYVLNETSEYRSLAFEHILAGSMSEGTKTFMPNELDVTCEFKDLTGLHKQRAREITVDRDSPWRAMCSTEEQDRLDPRKVTTQVYNAFSYALQSERMTNTSFGQLMVSPESLQLRNKISALCLLWRGKVFKDMIIFVDIVPAFHFPGEDEILITKTSQMYPFKGNPLQFHSVYRKREIAELAALPPVALHSYIIAKALRISAICWPLDIKSLYIEESIDIEDLITSFMLKSFLILLLETKDGRLLCMNAYELAYEIYSYLENVVGSDYRVYDIHNEVIFKCHYRPRSIRGACCLRRLMILAVCNRIRSWLQRNKLELHKISEDLKLWPDIKGFLQKCSCNSLMADETKGQRKNGHSRALATYFWQDLFQKTSSSRPSVTRAVKRLLSDI